MQFVARCQNFSRFGRIDYSNQNCKNILQRNFHIEVAGEKLKFWTYIQIKHTHTHTHTQTRMLCKLIFQLVELNRVCVNSCKHVVTK